MNWNDDGLGPAMSLSYAQQQGREAKEKAGALEVRVAELERIVAEMSAMIWPLGR